MPEYRFDVDANIKKAQQNINELMSLMGRLDKATQSAGKTDQFKNDDKALDLLQTYKKLSSEYEKLAASAQKYEQSSSFEGKTTDFQKLDTILQHMSGTVTKVAQGINELGSGTGGGLGQYAKDAERVKTTLGDNVKLIKEIKREEARARRLGNQQDRISYRASTTGYLSLRDLAKYKQNQKQIENLSNDTIRNNGMIHDFQNRYSVLQEQNRSGLNTDGNPLSADDLNKNHTEMRDIDKVLKTLRSSNTTIESTQETAASGDSLLAGASPLIGGEATLMLAGAKLATGVVKGAIDGFKNAVREGDKVNMSTGEQALNQGNVSGHVTDSDMRGRVQNIMWQNGLGYKTQDGLDYYALAQQSRLYKADDRTGKSDKLATNMTNAFEVGGRATGISDKSWRNTATVALNSGGIFTDKDIDRLSATIAGENVRSGNSGDAEGNARTITTAIQQLSRSTSLTPNGIGYLSATTAMLSRSSKAFSGERGERNINNIDQGFQNGATGSDKALLYMMISSNPSKYGGPNGMVRAQETLAKGLADPENINMVQNQVKRLGASGSQGKGVATLMLEQHFGLAPKDASTLAGDMLSGKYSTGALVKEARTIQKRGKTQTNRNLTNYKRSDQASRNTQEAQGEAINSQASGMVKWFRDIKNGIGQGMHGVGTWVGKQGSTLTAPFTGGKMYDLFGNEMLPSRASIEKKHSAEGDKGAFGASTVHAATLSKKEIEKDKSHNRLTTKSHKTHSSSKKSTTTTTTTHDKRTPTKKKPASKIPAHSRMQTSGATLDKKAQDEAKTKAYLNVRNEEKNLRTEKDNIDKRNASIRNFEKALKEEKNGIKSGSSGKAGTVGKKGLDTKKDAAKKSAPKTNSFKGLADFFNGMSGKKKTTSSKGGGKKLSNHNNITFNISSAAGKIGSDIGKQADLIGKKIAEYSRDITRR